MVHAAERAAHLQCEDELARRYRKMPEPINARVSTTDGIGIGVPSAHASESWGDVEQGLSTCSDLGGSASFRGCRSTIVWGTGDEAT